MKRKRDSAEQIISKLREAEVLLQKGQAVPQVCRQLGVAAQTYYLYGLLPLGKRNFRTA
jgi:predicted transcriptional regulator YheO